MIKVLIDHVANITVTDSYGRNLLHLAVSFYRATDKIKALLAEKVPINAPDIKGDTPLHYVLKRVQRSGSLLPFLKRRIELLMERGADPNIKNNEGKSPVDFAMESGIPKALKLLKKEK